MAMPFLQFWLVNFGAWVPLVLFFIGITALDRLETGEGSRLQDLRHGCFPHPSHRDLPSRLPREAGAVGMGQHQDHCLGLPHHPSVSLDRLDRAMAHSICAALVCVALFASGFVTFFGGLAAGKNGFGIADRSELDNVGAVVKKLPADARYAGYPTWGHPVLLQGRKMVLGYPGHLWTQGFDYADDRTTNCRL